MLDWSFMDRLQLYSKYPVKVLITYSKMLCSFYQKKPSQTLDLTSQKLSVNTTRSPYKQAYYLSKQISTKSFLKPHHQIISLRISFKLVHGDSPEIFKTTKMRAPKSKGKGGTLPDEYRGCKILAFSVRRSDLAPLLCAVSVLQFSKMQISQLILLLT